VEDVLDHVDYVVKLVGIDHVGFGTDLVGHWLVSAGTPPESSLRWWRDRRPDVFGRGPTDRYDPYPKELDSHTKLINITIGLLKRGYSEESIIKVLGGNFLRVFQTVWK